MYTSSISNTGVTSTSPQQQSTTSQIGTVVVNAGIQLASQGNNSDNDRYAKADTWYAAAIAGDAVALCFLAYMGGRRGCAPGGCGGSAACGFATDNAKNYAEALYQQATRVLSTALPVTSPLPQKPQGASTLGTGLQQVSQITGAAATGLGYPPAQTIMGAATPMQWLLIGGVAVVSVVVLARVLKR